jgi:hypothetical protein
MVVNVPLSELVIVVPPSTMVVNVPLSEVVIVVSPDMFEKPGSVVAWRVTSVVLKPSKAVIVSVNSVEAVKGTRFSVNVRSPVEKMKGPVCVVGILIVSEFITILSVPRIRVVPSCIKVYAVVKVYVAPLIATAVTEVVVLEEFTTLKEGGFTVNWRPSVEMAIAWALLAGHEIVSVSMIMPSGARDIIILSAIIIEVWAPISYVVPPITISSKVEVNGDGNEAGPLDDKDVEEVVKVEDTWMIIVTEVSQL